MSYDLFIFAGEPSGDLHGEKLLMELRALKPDIKIKGVGGPRMRAAGLDCFLNMEEFEVMGFTDVLTSLPRLYTLFKKIRGEILTASPKGVLFIDYPGFNLRMARSLKRKKSKAKRIHFICPSVWAWGKRRIPLMEKTLDKLFTILPFEPALFSPGKLATVYAGNPLVSRIQSHQYESNWRAHYGIPEDAVLISLFPGSRAKELKRNLELQLKAAKTLVQDKKDYLITLSCSSENFFPLLNAYKDEQIKIIGSSHLYELMRESHLAIATSGTITLELALHQVPTVVTYAIDPFDVFLATQIFRIHLPHYALPNIIAGSEVFPELFGPNLTEEALKDRVQDLLISQFKRNECIRGCERIRENLGNQNACRAAARMTLEALKL